jgi:hypothetical protein
MLSSRVAALAAILTACTACAHGAVDPPRTLAPAFRSSETGIRTAASILPPLRGEWLEELSDAAGRPVGMISIPLGARGPRPVIVAMHAASGRPDWMCGTTRDIAGGTPFIVCPHPIQALRTMASWGDGPSMRLVLDRALEGGARKYGAYMAADGLVYFGHSQSAMQSGEALTAAPGPALFRNVLLYEGAPPSIAPAARMLARSGVTRAVVVSGQVGWAVSHRSLALELERHGVHARYVHAGGDHYFGGPAIPALRESLQWLIEDAPTWAAGP